MNSSFQRRSLDFRTANVSFDILTLNFVFRYRVYVQIISGFGIFGSRKFLFIADAQIREL